MASMAPLQITDVPLTDRRCRWEGCDREATHEVRDREGGATTVVPMLSGG